MKTNKRIKVIVLASAIAVGFSTSSNAEPVTLTGVGAVMGTLVLIGEDNINDLIKDRKKIGRELERAGQDGIDYLRGKKSLGHAINKRFAKIFGW